MKLKSVVVAVLVVSGAVWQAEAQEGGTRSETAPETSVAGMPDLRVGVSESLPGRPAIAEVAEKASQRTKRLWYGSIVLMLAGNAADAATSWHKAEGNGLLASSNGTFGARGVGIKVGITGAILLPQILLRRNAEMRKGFIIGNLIDAGVFGGVAIHNSGVQAR